MNRQVFALAVSAAASAGFGVPADAQTSVSLYGVIDEGINYTNNAGRGHVYELTSGFAQASRWGLRGDEPLGGGLKAVFQLENGFQLSNGRSGGRVAQDGRLFGRQAFVGLSWAPYGTVTVGRQYDSVVDYLAQTTANGNWGGTLFSHPFDNDNTDSTFRLNNTIKYTSPWLSGFRFGGTYSFSNDTGFANNRAYSIGGQYAYGGLLVSGAYLQGDEPGGGGGSAASGTAGAIGADDAGFIAARVRVFGGGLTYTFGPATAGFVYSNSNYLHPLGSNYLGTAPLVPPGVLLNSLKFQNFEINGKYQISPMLFVGAQYVYTIETFDASSGGVKPRIHSFGLMAEYNLSKRTDFYIQGEYQQVSGDPTDSIFDYAFIPGTQSPSSTSRQVVVRAAIRHKF